MDFSEINPYIRFFWFRTVGDDYVEEILAYDFRIFYGLSGRFFVDTDGKSFEILPDSFAVIPPATPYRLRRAPDSEEHYFCVINFDMNCKRSDHKMSIRPQPERDFNPSLIISTDTPPETVRPTVFEGDYHTRDMIKEISHLFSARPHLYREESGALLKRVLTQAARKAMEKDPAEPKAVSEIIAYIKEHYKEPITNASIARQLKYHPNHLNRIFKAHTGKSLHNYIIMYRLKIAKELLISTDYRIDDIAQASGFESASYFSKYFRREFGDSPLKFRTEYIKQLV